MNLQDYNKASDRLQQLSLIFKLEILMQRKISRAVKNRELEKIKILLGSHFYTDDILPGLYFND